jgi:flagellin-specific chaperone FliS
MKSYLNAYKKQSVPVLPADGNVLLALFEKLQEHLSQAIDFAEHNQQEKFAQSVGKGLKVIDVLCAGLAPVEKIDGKPVQVDVTESPWNTYFATLIYVLNDAVLETDAEKIKQAQKSVEHMLSLFMDESLPE